MSLARTIPCTPVRLSAIDWLALQVLALWPHGGYLVERALDGSDDPLGLLALVALAVFVARQARELRLSPRLPWLVAALVTTMAANAAWVLGVPALAAGVIAALALAAALAAWWPAQRPLAPLVGLLLLALPLVASLQFYIGWPLRVFTAEASALALQGFGVDAIRDGATLLVNGRRVIVDAPCSGVQMAWLGYFGACACAAWQALPDGAFGRRLPLVGTIVLAMNVLRNSLLVALEARPEGLSTLGHQGIGLACLAAVAIAVCALMQPTQTLRSRHVAHLA